MNIIVIGIAGYNGGAGTEDARFLLASFLVCLSAALIAAAAYHLYRAPGHPDF